MQEAWSFEEKKDGAETIIFLVNFAGRYTETRVDVGRKKQKKLYSMSNKVEKQENGRRRNETTKCAQDSRQGEKLDVACHTETNRESVNR